MARNYKLTQTGQAVQDDLNKIEGASIEGGVIHIGGNSITPLTEETDPTVPAWAKAAEKPSYTADEVGALPDDTTLADLPADADHRTVSDAEKAVWDAKSDFSGDYPDLTNKPDLSQFITRSVDDLVNYYLKNEVYTKDEVADLLAGITGGIWVSVSVLPQPSADTYGLKIYLVPSQNPAVQNQKDEYITTRSGSAGNYSYAWEQIGTTAIDLSEYVTNEDLQDALEDYVSTEAFQQALENYLQVPVETSWSNLVVLRNTGELQPGRLYRITDYVATTSDANSRSANHPFDIIVQALSENALSETASAALHDGDTHFANAKLSAWQLSYCLDNDVARFSWADTENGKGVIYRLRDEWENEMPFDFKGIQFKRYYVTSVAERYADSLTPLVGLPIALAGTGSTGLVAGTEFKWYYTFSLLGNTWNDEVTDNSLTSKTKTTSIIDPSRVAPKQLNNNVFATGPVLLAFLKSFDGTTKCEADICSANARFEGEVITNNTFFGENANAFTMSHFRGNTIVGMHRHMDYATDAEYNTIFAYYDFAHCRVGHYLHGNVLVSKDISGNIFGVNCNNNYIYAVKAIKDNYFGVRFSDNNIRLSSQMICCVFGPDDTNNDMTGSSVQISDFGPCVRYCTWTNFYLNGCRFDEQITYCNFDGRFRGCNFGNYMYYIQFNGGTETATFAGVDIKGLMQGTENSYLVIDSPYFIVSSTTGIVHRRISLSGDPDGNLVATWMEDGVLTGIQKAPADADWSPLPQSYLKPSTGIPEADLAQTVQDKLNDAEVFVATYGSTTQSEVQAAVASGKVVVCFYNSRVYIYAGESAAGYSQFTSFLYDTAFRVYLKNSSWGNASLDIPTDAVKYSSQNLSDAQKTQARTNIGAGTYSKPNDGIPASDLADGVIPDVSQFITKSVNDLVNYYTKSQTYTQAEVQALIGAISQFHYEIAASTSAVVSPASNVLYLIGPTGSGADKYEEYVYANNAWVKIGDTSIDLSGYVTTAALNTALEDYLSTDDTVQAQELEIDSAPTANSQNLVTSGGVASALAGKYTKPAGGIPNTDLADPESVFIIPINLGTLTVDSSVTYQDIVDAYNAGKVFAFSFGAVGGIIPATQYGASNGEYVINAEYIMSVSSGGIDGASFVLQATSSALTFTMTQQELEVPEISTDIDTDGTSDDMTASPKAVKTFVEGKGYGTYSKPSGGIPESDLATAVTSKLNATEIFWATYGTTTFSAINTALGDNKVVLCKYGELVYVLTSYEESFFFSCPLGSTTYYLTVTSSNEWDNGSLQAELTQNKKTSVSANASSNTYYPTTKAVADYAQPIIDSTHKLDYSLLSNTPTIPSTYAGSPSAGGPANKALGIPFGYVDSTSTATVMTATVDNFPTTLTAGVCAYIRNDVIASASGWTLNINNTGALPVYSTLSDASRITTIFSAASTHLFIYNPTRVEGGCWDLFYGYNSDTNTIGYNLRTGAATPPTASKFYRYRILFTSQNGQSLIPANTSTSTNATAARAVNQAKIDPFGPIFYYSTTAAVEANASVGASYAWLQYSGIALGYSFNRVGAALTMTAKDPVYIKCAPQTDGSAIIDADTPFVQALPSTEDGKIYIYLGLAESATAITMYYRHPVYYYKGGAIRLWTNAAATSADEALSSSEIQDIWDDVMDSGTLISFTIESVSYQAEENMTWEQWVDSAYNTGGYVINSVSPRVCEASDNTNAIALSGNMVDPSDTIIDSTAYSISVFPLIPPIPED